MIKTEPKKNIVNERDNADVMALVAFMAQNGDPNTYVITDTNTWQGSDLKRHYNHERLRGLVALILMTPEFMSR